MSNRRSFLGTLLKGIGAFSILPPASTYGRIWKAARPPIFYGNWTKTECVNRWVSTENLEWLERNKAALSFFTLNPNVAMSFKDGTTHFSLPVTESIWT